MLCLLAELLKLTSYISGGFLMEKGRVKWFNAGGMVY